LTQWEADETYSGWRYQSEFPNQSNVGTICVVSSEAADTTQTITIKGITTAGVYAEEDIVLTGVTAADSTTNTYDEFWYAELDAEAVGIVTIARHSDTATITTIAAGDLTVGTDVPACKPDNYIIVPPNIEWRYPPDDNYTAWIRGGALPSDFTTPTSLGTGATFTITAAAGLITVATIASAGAGYYVGDVLTVVGGTSGTLTIATLTGGAGTGVATVSITTPGTGYSSGVKSTTSLRDQTVDSMPGEFHSALSNGAAALAETADLEAAAAMNRLSVAGQAFYDDIAALSAYLSTISRDRTGAIPMSGDGIGD
jgi:hypothetical protein